MDQREAARVAARYLARVALSRAQSPGVSGLRAADRDRLGKAYRRLADELIRRGGERPPRRRPSIPDDPDQMPIWPDD